MIHVLSTKEILAESIIELLHTQPISKITVKSITSNCSLTTTTFYNHFKDKYELLEWIFIHKIGTYISTFSETYDWYCATEDSLVYIYENKAFFRNIYINIHKQNSFPMEGLKQTYLMAHNIISKIFPDFFSNEANDFALQTYLYGLSIMVINWITSKNPISPILLAEYFIHSMPSALREVLLTKEHNL